MASGARFKLKHAPTDVWSIRERLSLASSVLRSGDQNWVSVSRAIKPYGETNRPAEWFSQKNCALQYAELLEKVQTPKRKRNDLGGTETPGDQIVRKLTIERIEELKRIVQDEQQKYKKLKRDIEAIKAGVSDDRIKEAWQEMLIEKKKAEEAAATVSSSALETSEETKVKTEAVKTPSKPATIAHKVKKTSPGLRLKMGLNPDHDDSTSDSFPDSIKTEDDSSNMSAPSTSSTPQPPAAPEEKPKTTPQSPLLSSLLATRQDINLLQQQSPQLQQKVQQQLQQQTLAAPAVVTESQPQTQQETVLLTPTVIKQEPIERETKSPSGLTPSLSGSQTPVSGRTPPARTKPTVTPPSLVLPNTSSLTSSETTPVVVKTEVPKSPAIEPVIKNESQPKSSDYETETETDAEDKVTEETAQDTRNTMKEESPIKEELGVTSEDALPTTPVRSTAGLDDDPPSPASSVRSYETDGGSASTSMRGRPPSRRSRGSGRGRRMGRMSRSITLEEEKRDRDETASKPSEAESSDDEATMPESDDASSGMPRRTTSISESVPNSPASLSQCSDTEDEKAYKVWKKSIMLVWRSASNHKYANVFLHPVTDEIAPGYRSIVYRPMDLSTIKKNIETAVIRTTAEFQRDMMLMFTNAIMYNNSDHNVYHMANEMYNDVMMHIEQYVNTQMMVNAETKILRGSRRSEAASSDKEDETKKRRISDDKEGGKAKKRKLV